MRLQVGRGLDDYLSKLGNLEMSAPDAIGKAIYEGAAIVAKQVETNIKNLPVDDNLQDGQAKGPRTIQKMGLEKSFGIARKQNENGYINVKLGFDGYNNLKSKKYPSGQPNAMIARTFEAGNSFTKKCPFIAPAIRKTKATAEAKMGQVIDTEISKIYSL